MEQCEEIVEVNKPFEQVVYQDARILIPANLRNIYGITPGCVVELTLKRIRKNNNNAKLSAETKVKQHTPQN